MELLKTIKTSFKNKKILSMIIRGNVDNIKKTSNATMKKNIFFLAIVYAIIVIFFILLSMPLLALSLNSLREHPVLYTLMEFLTFVVLLFDYVMRWVTADVQLKKGKLSYIIFPVKLLSIILLLGLLPTFYIINIFITSNDNHIIWVVFSILKLFRIVRIIMVASLFSSLYVLRKVIQSSKNWLVMAIITVLVTISIFALAIDKSETYYFAHSSGTIPNNAVWGYWTAAYYCTIAITTIGFGDIQVYSTLSRVLTIILAFIGLVLITIPAGIFAGSFMVEIRKINTAKNKKLIIEQKKLEKIEEQAKNKIETNKKIINKNEKELKKLKENVSRIINDKKTKTK